MRINNFKSLISEKHHLLKKINKFTYIVNINVHKKIFINNMKKIYNIKVKKINVINIKKFKKIFKGKLGYTNFYKKIICTLY